MSTYKIETDRTVALANNIDTDVKKIAKVINNIRYDTNNSTVTLNDIIQYLNEHKLEETYTGKLTNYFINSKNMFNAQQNTECKYNIVIIGDYMYAYGADYNNYYTAVIYKSKIYNITDTNNFNWIKVGEYKHTNRFYYSSPCTVYNNKIYMVIDYALLVFDTITNTFQYKTSYFSSQVLAKGFEQYFLGTTYRYDVNTDSKTEHGISGWIRNSNCNISDNYMYFNVELSNSAGYAFCQYDVNNNQYTFLAQTGTMPQYTTFNNNFISIGTKIYYITTYQRSSGYDFTFKLYDEKNTLIKSVTLETNQVYKLENNPLLSILSQFKYQANFADNKKTLVCANKAFYSPHESGRRCKYYIDHSTETITEINTKIITDEKYYYDKERKYLYMWGAISGYTSNGGSGWVYADDTDITSIKL